MSNTPTQTAPTMCSAHPWRAASIVVNGEGVCEACELNVTCPLCGDQRYGRHVTFYDGDTPSPFGMDGGTTDPNVKPEWLHCENPACRHRWPFRDVSISEETSTLAWSLAFTAWMQNIPTRAAWGLGLPFHWRPGTERNLTDAERQRWGRLEWRANDLNAHDLRAVARMMPDFGTPDSAHMFDCSIIESLNADDEHIIPDGVTNAELLDALDAWLTSRNA